MVHEYEWCTRVRSGARVGVVHESAQVRGSDGQAAGSATTVEEA